MSNMNDDLIEDFKYVDIENMEIGIIYPLNERKMVYYKVVSPAELSYKDWYDAEKKITLGDKIHKTIVVTTDNGVDVTFKLSGIKKLKNDKRWIIEWYDGKIKETKTGKTKIKKTGNIHREAFARSIDFLDRITELNAINGEINIIDKMYECNIKKLTGNDICTMYDDFEFEEDE